MKIHAEEQGLRIKEVTPEAMAVLQQYEWPGNIRELRNLIERLMIMVPGPVIDAPQATMSLQGRASSPAAAQASQPVSPLLTKSYDSLRDARNAFEKEYIARKLREHHWNISRKAGCFCARPPRTSDDWIVKLWWTMCSVDARSRKQPASLLNGERRKV
jgi:two-component system nitrogen regulation response regulator NtrX